MLSAPVGLVLSQHMIQDPDLMPASPTCINIYNVFYPNDPSAFRLEPLVNERFHALPAVQLPRYSEFPLGDTECVISIDQTVQINLDLFTDPHPAPSPQHHYPSLLGGRFVPVTGQEVDSGGVDRKTVERVLSTWWGRKRLDYALSSPASLRHFPRTALTFLLHNAAWESMDLAAFILRQVLNEPSGTSLDTWSRTNSVERTFTPTCPREKWLKKRTNVKVAGLSANHHANDVLVLENCPQVFKARFVYGMLDMSSLTKEKVDIHIMTSPPGGEWKYYDTVLTDNQGWASYKIPQDKQLPQGMYPVKFVVRGDHTLVDLYLTVLPPYTDTAVFSVDGSLTASMSLTGTNPKIRAGAVDVIRHYQELGYLILYLTARPGMQQSRVIAWLAQHNFPHGLLLMSQIARDPMTRKMNMLKNTIQLCGLNVRAAYGSKKDIWVYGHAGIEAQSMYIISKNKKSSKEAKFLDRGYAAHLEELTHALSSRPASTNPSFLRRRTCFSLPGQSSRHANPRDRGNSSSDKRNVRKTVSFPQERGGSCREGPYRRSCQEVAIHVSQAGNTVIQPKLRQKKDYQE